MPRKKRGQIKVHDKVRLTEEIPGGGDDVLSRGAPAGAIGYVIHVKHRPKRGYDVEILDEAGRAWSLVTVGREQIEVVEGGGEARPDDAAP